MICSWTIDHTRTSVSTLGWFVPHIHPTPQHMAITDTIHRHESSCFVRLGMICCLAFKREEFPLPGLAILYLAAIYSTTSHSYVMGTLSPTEDAHRRSARLALACLASA